MQMLYNKIMIKKICKFCLLDKLSLILLIFNSFHSTLFAMKVDSNAETCNPQSEPELITVFSKKTKDIIDCDEKRYCVELFSNEPIHNCSEVEKLYSKIQNSLLSMSELTTQPMTLYRFGEAQYENARIAQPQEVVNKGSKYAGPGLYLAEHPSTALNYANDVLVKNIDLALMVVKIPTGVRTIISNSEGSNFLYGKDGVGRDDFGNKLKSILIEDPYFKQHLIFFGMLDVLKRCNPPVATIKYDFENNWWVVKNFKDVSIEHYATGTSSKQNFKILNKIINPYTSEQVRNFFYGQTEKIDGKLSITPMDSWDTNKKKSLLKFPYSLINIHSADMKKNIFKA